MKLELFNLSNMSNFVIYLTWLLNTIFCHGISNGCLPAAFSNYYFSIFGKKKEKLMQQAKKATKNVYIIHNVLRVNTFDKAKQDCKKPEMVVRFNLAELIH